MKSYHILFLETAGVFVSTGKNFDADNPYEALYNFYGSYPGAVFIGLHDLEAMNSLHINRKSIQDQVDKEEHYNKTYP